MALVLFLAVLSSNISSLSVYGAENEKNHKEYSSEDVLSAAKKALEYEKTSIGDKNKLIDDDIVMSVTDSLTDWLCFGAGRFGYETDNYEKYIDTLKTYVSGKYKKDGTLSDSEATAWHTISLTALSLGSDPTSFGVDEKGDAINLIADGVYNRSKTVSLGNQGTNAYSWGLITLDSMCFKVPEDASDTRESIITSILSRQVLSDGGFGLSSINDSSDIDITAMVCQALAPYYNSEEEYSYKNYNDQKEYKKSVRQVVDEALEFLSKKQFEDGGYGYGDSESSESAAQVIVALTSLGIDLNSDERFIKNECTVLDALMKYQQKDGGFAHANKEEDQSGSGGESNYLATGQAVYALNSYYRFCNGYRRLYDFRQEESEDLKEKIKEEISLIDGLEDDSSKEDIKNAFDKYKEIEESERSYVNNYKKLADLMEKNGVKNDSEYLSKAYEINHKAEGYIPDSYIKGTNTQFIIIILGILILLAIAAFVAVRIRSKRISDLNAV
ncbi:prenyltransferase/squalene oxidase repeat-containing protein [Acetitomaculum ruminis]|nr:prenyltransferase/squalene oxidase repeat-containing protein [Acetitomaculum ruminis]